MKKKNKFDDKVKIDEITVEQYLQRTSLTSDIINNSNNYNNNIINNSIKSNHTKIKPKMELPNNNTYINKININNSNINNQSKMSFPTSSHQGGSFISATSMVENPFKDNTSYNKENINN